MSVVRKSACQLRPRTHLRSSFSMSRRKSRLSPREAARLKLTLNALQSIKPTVMCQS